MTANPEPTPAPYEIHRDWVVQPYGGCTCGTGSTAYGHEPGCGYEPLFRITEIVDVEISTVYGNLTPMRHLDPASGIDTTEHRVIERHSADSAIGQFEQNGWPVMRRTVITCRWEPAK